MELQDWKQEVYEANQELVRLGLVLFTWGNVSACWKEKGWVIIKPSGVPYETMKPEDMVVVDMEGRPVEGKLRPSSDLPTHLALYRAWPELGGITHTHSTYATIFAQARKSLPCLGTAHADTFLDDVPCTRPLTEAEIQGEYEYETGKVIVQTFQNRNAMETPAVLVSQHGPFTWGKTAGKSVENAAILEQCAQMAVSTFALNPKVPAIDRALMEKHFFRKHGKNAYYGQN